MGDLSGINHVTFLTGDMDRLVAFYEDVFGARKLMELPTRDGDGRHALIDVGGGATLHPFQLPQTVPPPQPMFARGRIDHFALNAPDAETFDALRSRLLERGATDGEVTDFGLVRVLVFTDPDGHAVELACWVGGSDPAALDVTHATDDV